MQGASPLLSPDGGLDYAPKSGQVEKEPSLPSQSKLAEAPDNHYFSFHNINTIFTPV